MAGWQQQLHHSNLNRTWLAGLVPRRTPFATMAPTGYWPRQLGWIPSFPEAVIFENFLGDISWTTRGVGVRFTNAFLSSQTLAYTLFEFAGSRDLKQKPCECLHGPVNLPRISSASEPTTCVWVAVVSDIWSIDHVPCGLPQASLCLPIVIAVCDTQVPELSITYLYITGHVI